MAMPVDQSFLDQIALSRQEYELIVARLGREPTEVEMGMFGALWSEHCGYKNPRPPPSGTEPYPGAAAGSGGIVRDIFAMGARPVALLDSLRFGPLDEARNRYLFGGVVGGIGGHGHRF